MDGEDFTWSADGGESKFRGLFTCFQKTPSFLQDYDYIAIPDDDLICTKDDWNTAFALAREYKVAACQLSLNTRSFYSHSITLRRKSLRLRWVTMVEPIAPIIRADILQSLMPIFALPNNMWAIDDAISDLVVDDRSSLAILDAASVVHTREVMSSALYSPLWEDGKTPAQVQAEFMQRHGIKRHKRVVVGAVDAHGQTVADPQSISKKLYFPRLLQRFRRLRGTVTIARRELVIFRGVNALRNCRAKVLSLRQRNARVGIVKQ
ncbi:hypothetical protein [Bradyrhizobium sp. LHD-71]|uniref:hypothetical protein n=1 Tax=Bradyrhizobium sp. LHD-71 TaxID=3072141 RepID=UPI00280EBB81|nr:hypothetical protein [Bradyrhizobium sp. LHD-71]MDQ8727662.1 hypothetical protein [Bradyrhizobium sp. LHD-71]